MTKNTMIIQESASKILEQYFNEAVVLLKDLIAIPSLSKEEDKTAARITNFLGSKGIASNRSGNNVWASNYHYDPTKPSLLLNSHHDTVKPNKGYTNDPFQPVIRDGKLYGLGSNDAGGCLVSLIETFIHFYSKDDLPYNIVLAATAEEENSGKDGVESILNEIKPLAFGIVGEPTEMKMAVVEKGLMVLDCYAKGESGHAARDMGKNAILEAVTDIEWFSNYRFPKVSDHLGPVKMTTTMIDAGYQHNVIPDNCHFVVDVRTTDKYSNSEVLEIINKHVNCEVKPRSIRLNPSKLPEDHAISVVADEMGIEKYGSPTTSDQAVMDFATFKMGPGVSERSHTADEYILLEEVREGIRGYINLLTAFFEKI